jgi:hypothetical protein
MRVAFGFLSLLLVLGADVAAKPAPKPPSSALTFELDAGRILVNASFKTPEGGTRKALAWFNMGRKSPILTKALYAELGLDRGAPLRLAIGETVLEAPSQGVRDDGDSADIFAFPQYFGPHKVEAMLPASLFLDRRLTLNYKSRTLAVEPASEKRPQGVAVPIALNAETGLCSVVARIDGRDYAFVLDAGSGYSWMRGAVLAPWQEAHPDWRRAQGAVGAANYNMLDFDFEKRGTVARLPSVQIGALELKEVGVLGSAPLLGGYIDALTGDLFWDNWQKSAPGPVVGWLGANVLERYALTIDYPNRISYWRALAAPDAHDLDSVGVTLVRRDGRYFIGGLVQAEAQPAGEGALVGDELLSVGDLQAEGAPRGVVLAALHGRPGETRKLTLARDGATREIVLPVLDLH